MSRLCRKSTALLAICLLLLSSAPHAEPSSATKPQKTSGLEWPEGWPRFRIWEYAATAASYGILAYVQYGVTRAFEPRWEGGILFDETVRDGLLLSTRAGRDTANEVSDVTWAITQIYPIADTLIVSLVVHRNIDLAWQLSMINAQVYGLTSMLSRTMHGFSRRARPLYGECKKDRAYDGLCGGSGSISSFWSGHTSMSFAGAGLTCVHHAYLPLYGGGLPDRLACATSVALATTTGVLRILSDRHYATDVLVGGAFGFAVGYGLPWLLHYRYPKQGRPTRRTAWFPAATEDSLSLHLSGIF